MTIPSYYRFIDRKTGELEPRRRAVRRYLHSVYLWCVLSVAMFLTRRDVLVINAQIRGDIVTREGQRGYISDCIIGDFHETR